MNSSPNNHFKRPRESLNLFENISSLQGTPIKDEKKGDYNISPINRFNKLGSPSSRNFPNLEDKDGFVVPTLIPRVQPPINSSHGGGDNKTGTALKKEILLDEKDLVDRSFQVLPVVSI